ncbi:MULTISPECIES: DUF5681 domain-containing protein [unclassified Sphingomonas]|uniref:DUF5681 domain-containing protein n=1 Tax=unclassified Sphingomonas TaxID=196159 RepID=UPI000AC5B4FB|nr:MULTISPECIES: DUF5681 domain-containing protein [unclassified Sphingomonas]
MTTAIQPPWGTDWKPAPPPIAAEPRGPGNPAWTPGCPSPNPKGRPAGLPDKRLLATQAALDEIKAIVQMLVGRALEGDVNAASIVLAKVLPSVKAQAEKVAFDFDPTAPISEQVAQVLQAVSEGKLAADVGRLICDSIARLADVRATEELAARIEALEEARDARG